MKMLKRILLATDFEPSADTAKLAATKIAKKFNSEVVPLHVIRGVTDLPAAIEWSDIKAAALDKLEGVVTDLHEAGVKTGQPIIDVGSAYAWLIEHANLQDVNVIVLGSGQDPDAVGSTAEQVARRSNKPVWVVKHGGEIGARRIVCPFDYSAHSKRALANAIHLARQFEAKLMVLHVVEKPSALFAESAQLKGHDPRAHIESQRRRLHDAVSACDAHGVDVEIKIVEGKAIGQIVAAAEQFEADLLVMGSAGRTGLSRLFLGSVATKVLRRLPCSVITVKAEQAIRVEFDEDADSNSAVHYERGRELLSIGCAEEAVSELRRYLQLHSMSDRACDLLATACSRLGRLEEAQKYRDQADEIRRSLEKRQIEADARRQHPLWNP